MHSRVSREKLKEAADEYANAGGNLSSKQCNPRVRFGINEL